MLDFKQYEKMKNVMDLINNLLYWLIWNYIILISVYSFSIAAITKYYELGGLK